MSNPPIPPGPPQYPQYSYSQQPYAGYNPYASLQPQSTWCRTAGMFQIVLGSIITLLAFCLLVGGAMIASGAIPPEQLSEIEGTAELHGKLHVIMFAMGAGMALGGIVHIVLGIFVWRRSMAGVITSLVLTSIQLLSNLVLLGGAVALLGATPQGMCFYGCSAIVSAALLSTLIMALRELRRGANTASQYQQQWQQYYQAYYQAAAAQQAPPPVGSAAPPPQPQLAPPPSPQEPPAPPTSPG